MNLKYAILICSFISFTTFAVEITGLQIEDQKEDQNRCVQERVPDCMLKCGDANEVNCYEVCVENAKNECLYAGE